MTGQAKDKGPEKALALSLLTDCCRVWVEPRQGSLVPCLEVWRFGCRALEPSSSKHKKPRKERQATRESARVVNHYALCTLRTARPTHETFLPYGSVPLGVLASSGECCGTAAAERHTFALLSKPLLALLPEAQHAGPEADPAGSLFASKKNGRRRIYRKASKLLHCYGNSCLF